MAVHWAGGLLAGKRTHDLHVVQAVLMLTCAGLIKWRASSRSSGNNFKAMMKKELHEASAGGTGWVGWLAGVVGWGDWSSVDGSNGFATAPGRQFYNYWYSNSVTSRKFDMRKSKEFKKLNLFLDVSVYAQ